MATLKGVKVAILVDDGFEQAATRSRTHGAVQQQALCRFCRIGHPRPLISPNDRGTDFAGPGWR